MGVTFQSLGIVCEEDNDLLKNSKKLHRIYDY